MKTTIQRAAMLLSFCLMSCSEVSIEEQMENCKGVEPHHIQNILDGMKNTSDIGKFRLDNVYAIRSKDRKKLYFVSGELIYTPTNTHYGIGTWALGSISELTSYYWSMPGPATERTVYPDATQNKAKISKLDRGYTASRKCTRLEAEN